MLQVGAHRKPDLLILISILLLTGLSATILNSLGIIYIEYIAFIVIGLLLYLFFAHLDIEILSIFSKYFYIISIILLLATIVIGQATRGTIRWIPIGNFTIQPAEIIRPFLLVFFAMHIVSGKKNIAHFLVSIALFAFPAFLILIQPSFGVSVLTTVGFIGVLIAASFPWKYYLALFGALIVVVPVVWGLFADYQRQRVLTFLSPGSDPQGVGYNSIQAMISVGSGKLTGKGLGRGVGTQLEFLPERQTDFIFASIAEELGFLGAILAVVITFFIFFKLVKIVEKTNDQIGRAYVSGLLLSYFAQVFIHVGMNLSILPITGVPLPLVSAGGSSLIATMIGLGIASSVSTSKT